MILTREPKVVRSGRYTVAALKVNYRNFLMSLIDDVQGSVLFSYMFDSRQTHIAGNLSMQQLTQPHKGNAITIDPPTQRIEKMTEIAGH